MDATDARDAVERVAVDPARRARDARALRGDDDGARATRRGVRDRRRGRGEKARDGGNSAASTSTRDAPLALPRRILRALRASR